MRVLVAEKPSVARDIAKVVGASQKKDGFLEGNGYQITWCFGHLIAYSTPDRYGEEYQKWSFANLPIIPDVFKTDVIENSKKQFLIIRSLLNHPEVTEVICATDAGREGELIFGLVYRQANCQKPFRRLWISSMTDEAIADGLQNLKDGREYDRLYQSARCRAEADWLIGLNATRLFTVKYNLKLTVGRVQTPTLAMIVNRHLEIVNFKPEPFYQLRGNFDGFSALWQDKKGNSKLKEQAAAEAIRNKCQGQPGTIIGLETKEKSLDRPQLYDLTELQRDANRRYGYTAQQVLDAAQSLYETHKLTTYPRTDSRCITKDMVGSLKPVLNGIKQNNVFGFAAQAEALQTKGLNLDKRVVDDSKVTDHHAIIPTHKIQTADLTKLSDKEQKVFKLIAARFIVAL
ncbi:MAG TPA: DNA topoisomerase, partial [Bacillota bacterium]|nr:DNA topoisomerase [Bacillota bacterium]